MLTKTCQYMRAVSKLNKYYKEPGILTHASSMLMLWT